MAFYLRCTCMALHAHGVGLGIGLMSSRLNLINALVCDYDTSLLSSHVHFGYILNSRVK